MMLTTEEAHLQFVEHVQKMRTAQKAADDVMAKYYERQVDRALLRLEWVKKEDRLDAIAARKALADPERISFEDAFL